MTENDYSRIEYRVRKKANLCTRCGGQDAYTLAGRFACARCTELINQNRMKFTQNPEWKETRNNKRRSKRDEFRENGLCTICGERPPSPGYVRCEYCRAKQRRYMAKYRGQLALEAPANMCHRCKKKPMAEGHLLCEGCYAKQCESLVKAREAQRKMKDEGWVHPWKKSDERAFIKARQKQKAS